jgi:hypothetical protein
MPMTHWQLLDQERVATTTTVAITLAADPSTARLVATKGPADPDGCPSSLEMDAILSIQTEDGAFREKLHGNTSIHRGAITFAAEMPFDDRRGNYTAEVCSQCSTLSAALLLIETGGQTDPYWQGTLSILDASGKLSFSAASW